MVSVFLCERGLVSHNMVKPLEKSINFWDGHGPLRLVELWVGEGPETEIEQ